MQAHEHPPQCPMVGLVEALDAPQRFRDRNALIVNFLRVADHARDRAQAPGNPHRARIGEGRQSAVEHPRIEFVRLAIDVDVAPREMRPHQRMAAGDDACNQLVDERVLGTSQGGEIEPRRQQELARIDPAAVR